MKQSDIKHLKSIIDELDKEIKEEPMTAEEWVSKKHNTPIGSISLLTINGLDLLEAFKASESNNELKHQETESASEAYRKPDGPSNDYTAFCNGWRAHAKSRGYE